MSSSTLAPDDQAVVASIKEVSEGFAEKAQDTDRNGPLNDGLRENIRVLLRLGFFGSSISKEYGGLGLSSGASRSCLKLIAAACGVTAFTQQQLHAGGNFIGGSEDEELRRELLPQFASGENICGVGFSHLRRLGPAKVTAIRTDHGFIINGQVPWISAWSMLDSFILGATVTDGNMIFCYLPIGEFRQCMTPSAPMKLSVMDSSETVQLSLANVEMPARFVISEHGPDHMVRNDFRHIAGHTEMPLGCALGSASLLRAIGEKNDHASVIWKADQIVRRVSEIESLALSWGSARSEEPDFQQNALAARTGAITIAISAASAAVAAAGGSAHLVTSPAQRRFRESAFYATQAQTLEIQQSLLEAFIDD